MTDANDMTYDTVEAQESELPVDNRYLIFMSDEELRKYWEAEKDEYK